jgi:putative phosphoribosyl transferase
MLFYNREEAGRELGSFLRAHRERFAHVLALPRGGVPVAWEVAHTLNAPLDIWGVRKVRLPEEPAVSLGAVAEGAVFLDLGTARGRDMSSAQLQTLVNQEIGNLNRQVSLYREGRPSPTLEGADVILVDDGIATGATARAAIRAIRQQQPSWITLAVPVGSAEVLEHLRPEVDELLCLHPRRDLSQVGVWYRKPEPIADEDVRRLLRSAEELRLTESSAHGYKRLHVV